MSEPPAPRGDAPAGAAPVAAAAPQRPGRGPGHGQSAGAGLAFITLAKLWFMVGGAAISFLLPRAFPRDLGVQRYGQWGTVLAWVSVLNNVIVTGTIQMVSKFASRGPKWVEGAKREALRVNLFLVGGVAIALVGAAPFIAALEHDADLVPLLRLATGVVLAYGLYAVFVGGANGAREFGKQASLDFTFTTLRAGLVLVGAWLTGSVLGAMAGFVLAALLILALSTVRVGLGAVEERPRTSELLAFVGPVALYLLVQNALMFVDLWWLKRLLSEGAVAAGALPADAARLADAGVGRYNAALQIARLPYQAILAVTFVVFPLVSGAEFAADLARTRAYVTRALRLSLLVVTLLATSVAARPDALLGFLFPKNGRGVNEYLEGAPALAALMFAYVAYSLLSIAGTIINGTGRTRPTLLIGLVTLVVDVVATGAAIRHALAVGESPLVAAAYASTGAILLGFVLSLGYLQWRFGASLPLATAARVVVAAAVGIGVGRVLPLPEGAGLVAQLARLAACAAGGLVYVGALFATGELSLAEVRALRRGRS